jgi:Family of unknown function (DUF6328)
MRKHQGVEERCKAASDWNATEIAPLHSRIEQMLTEARVILPGAQALLGFQLAIVLTETFEKLPTLPRLLHATALLSVAVSVILLITPAALHRIVWAGEDTETLLRHGGRITCLRFYHSQWDWQETLTLCFCAACRAQQVQRQ